MEPVSNRLEMTALSDCVLRSAGLALWWQAARRAGHIGRGLGRSVRAHLAKAVSEIVDFYLPPEGCSYLMAIISTKKAYPGRAKRVMFGLWSFLRQLMCTKFKVARRNLARVGPAHPHGSCGASQVG